ncbi:uncharacterized protein [Nicotiana sylvestris]|uniref:uncharacterized protein n=1 Tax=Nicotiana sylvestris TaxID=4096 RepID=UPI00388C67A7
MKEGETIQEMYTRFTTLTNELKSLRRVILEEDKVEKILTRVFPVTWESKITAIQESKNIATLKLDQLIGNLTAYKLRRQTMKMDAPKKEKSLALRITEGTDLEEDEMAMITKGFKKYLMRGKGSSRGASYNKPRKKERVERRNRKKEHVHSKKNKGPTNAMVAAWGESSDEDSEDEDGDEESLMAIRESDEKSEELLSKEYVMLKAKCKNQELRASESDSKNAELKNQVLELDTTMLELRSENLKLKLGIGKKKNDHTHLTIEKNLGKMKDELYKRDERIRVLKKDLSKVKHELDRTCK